MQGIGQRTQAGCTGRFPYYGGVYRKHQRAVFTEAGEPELD